MEPDDLLCSRNARNRGPDQAPLEHEVENWEVARVEDQSAPIPKREQAGLFGAFVPHNRIGEK
jgi:hypothetical protein